MLKLLCLNLSKQWDRVAFPVYKIDFFLFLFIHRYWQLGPRDASCTQLIQEERFACLKN